MQGRPVVIAGAGPVGLAVALGLHRADIPVMVFDPHPSIPRDPRATTLQPRVLELLAEWGALADLLDEGVRVDALQYWDWSSHTLLASLDYSLLGEETHCPYRLHVPQWEVCEALLARLPAGTVHWGQRVAGFDELGDHVVVEIDGAAEPLGIEARALVGADGSASTVRRLLGVSWELGPRDTFLTCEVPLEFAEQLPEGIELGPCAHLLDGSRWVVWMEMADSIRLLFHVEEGTVREAMGDAALRKRAKRLLRHGSSFDTRILRSRAVYAVQQRIARSFGRGHVALAGDAAHSAFPVGGMAMNAGLLDAERLVTAIVEGLPDHVEAYSEERRAASTAELLEPAAEARHRLSARGLLARWAQNRAIRGLGDSQTATAHLRKLSML